MTYPTTEAREWAVLRVAIALVVIGFVFGAGAGYFIGWAVWG